MKTISLISALILTLLFSCDKPTDDIPSIDTTNPIQLSNLEPRQQSTYVRYFLRCDDIDGSFEWTNDTLLLEVLRDGNIRFYS